MVGSASGGPDPAARLLRAVAAGDAAAFTALYDRFAARLHRYCLARLGNRQAAEDACQEVMLAVWRGAGSFGGQGSVAAWLFAIAGRKTADAWRRARPPTVAEDRLPQGVAPPPDSATRLDLAQGLARLPPAQRETVLLVYVAGLTCAEVAACSGVPEGTVKSRLRTGRLALAKEVQR